MAYRVKFNTRSLRRWTCHLRDDNSRKQAPSRVVNKQSKQSEALKPDCLVLSEAFN